MVPDKNSTRASWFSGLLAEAARLIVAGAAKVAPLVGLVRVTEGGPLGPLTVTVTDADVVEAPALSKARAASV